MLSVVRRLLLPLVVLVLLVGGADAHAAHRHPTVSLTLPSGADAGAGTPFSWQATHLRRDARLVVQRQQGTARAWRTMLSLSQTRGSANLPSLALGVYRLRVAMVGRHHRLLAQQQRTLHVFGTVPFSTLFGTSSAGIYSAPSRTFSYVAANDYDYVHEPATWLTFRSNRCRSVHIDFVPGAEDGLSSDPTPTGYTGTLSLVQETRDPLSASALYNSFGSLDAPLVPGQSWSLQISQVGVGQPHAGGTDGYYTLIFYINGSASCDSVKGWE